MHVVNKYIQLRFKHEAFILNKHFFPYTYIPTEKLSEVTSTLTVCHKFQPRMPLTNISIH